MEDAVQNPDKALRNKVNVFERKLALIKLAVGKDVGNYAVNHALDARWRGVGEGL